MFRPMSVLPPIRWVLFFIALYFLIWSIAPTLLASSVALDVSEGINWGSEWQWGYYKHPPLSSWLLYTFFALFGHLGVYLISQLCVLISMWCHYHLAKLVYLSLYSGNMVSTLNAANKPTIAQSGWVLNQNVTQPELSCLASQAGLLASLLTLSVFYYTYPTLEFNHNIAQFPIWSGLVLAFYLAIRKNRWQDWLWVGVLGGLGMLTKYTVIFLLLPMALWLVYPKNICHLKSPKPWVAASLMFAIFAPHLYWLATHDWLPLSYAQGRSHENTGIGVHFSWLGFSLSQILAHLPLILILFWSRRYLNKSAVVKHLLPHLGCRLLLYLWLSPLALLCALSLLLGLGLRDMWGMPMWGLSAVVAAISIPPATLSGALSKMAKGVGVWLSVITVLMLIYVGFGHQIRDKPSRLDWSQDAIAKNAIQTWQAHSTCTLDSLAGDRWLTALVAINSGKFTGNPRWHLPSQLFEGGANKSPWMTASRLKQHGTLLLWQAKDNPQPPKIELLETSDLTGLSIQQGTWLIDWAKNPDAQPLQIHWMMYLPTHCINQ